VATYPPPPSAGTTSGDASGPRAGFWRRFAAYFVDAVLIGIVSSVLAAIIGFRNYSWISPVLGLIYFTYLEGGLSGQTFGKRMLGIRVYDFRAGGPIGYGRAFIRTIGRYVSAIVCLLGYFWMLWDKEKQTWHDKFANDVVVPVTSYPVASWPG
jgi:uncharacterized RDD family membrane protein YckC